MGTNILYVVCTCMYVCTYVCLYVCMCICRNATAETVVFDER